MNYIPKCFVTLTILTVFLVLCSGCEGLPFMADMTPAESSSVIFSFPGESVCPSEENRKEETEESVSVTEFPATVPPTTEPPATQTLATEPPVTESPATELPHVHAYVAAVKEATCTEGGYTTYTCSCGDSYQSEQTSAKGHTYVDTIVAPTTTQKGYTEHTCSCGYSYLDSHVDPIKEEFPFTGTELSAAVIKYINEYRKEDGVPELIPQPIMEEIAKVRSEQLLADYKHDVRAIRKICAVFQYGKYIDMTQYGYDSSYNYYDARLAEAIGHFAAIKESVDEAAKHIALAFRNSSAHWSYLGDSRMEYIAVGCSKDKYDWYVCIFVSDITYG